MELRFTMNVNVNVKFPALDRLVEYLQSRETAQAELDGLASSLQASNDKLEAALGTQSTQGANTK